MAAKPVRVFVAVWFNPKMGKYVATPAEGQPGHKDLYATGETEDAAIEALLEAADAGALD